MRVHLHGGFGEKGRTCLLVETEGFRLLLDAGVKTSAAGTPDYYPRISRAELEAVDATVITHGHEDHAAALGWCVAQGLKGPIHMTPESQRDTWRCLVEYAAREHVDLVREADVRTLDVGVRTRIGPFTLDNGRSGHIGGGVWSRVADARRSLTYCGDVMTESPVFAMDPLPPSDVLVLDASYGDDDVDAAQRAREVGAWVAAHPKGSVLPTPLQGRSAELLAVVEGPIALAPGMREALHEQIAGTAWLRPAVVETLRRRLAGAQAWSPDAPLPAAALLCHDGMGMSGPSRMALERGRDATHAALLTGHVPEGTIGHDLLRRGRADWIRLPTHPRLSANVAMASASGASTLLGHSCDLSALQRLAGHLPALRATLVTGDSLDV